MVPHSWMQAAVTLQLSDFSLDCLLQADFLQMYDTLPRAGLQDSYSYNPD